MFAASFPWLTFPLLLFMATSIHGFSVSPQHEQLQYHQGLVLRTQTSDQDLTFNPTEGYRFVNVPRANYCAQNFGACSVEEMEDLRNNLHKERLQNFVFGGGSHQHTTKEDLEHFVLEEELELQLSLLKDAIESHQRTSALFPQVEEPMEQLPHLKDESFEDAEFNKHQEPDVIHAVEDVLHQMEHTLAMQEPALLEESNLETIAMCAVLLVVALAPEVFQFWTT